MTDKKDSEHSDATVYYDGDCPMCRTFTAHLDTNKEKDGTNFQNFRTQALPDDIDPLIAAEKIHLRDDSGQVLSGAQAVLRILERKSKYTWLVRLGRLPGIRGVAEVLYWFIAKNRFFMFGPYARIYWTKNLLAVGFLIPLIITRKLWFGATSRFYALTPVWNGLPEINYPLDHLLFGLMVALLLGTLLSSKPRAWIIGFLAISVPYSLWDQSRWMPYNYQFFMMFLVLATFSWKPETDKEKAAQAWKRVSASLGIIVIGIWAWSGLHKISMRYLALGFPWLVSPFTKGFSPEVTSAIHALGFTSTPVASCRAPEAPGVTRIRSAATVTP